MWNNSCFVFYYIKVLYYNLFNDIQTIHSFDFHNNDDDDDDDDDDMGVDFIGLRLKFGIKATDFYCCILYIDA